MIISITPAISPSDPLLLLTQRYPITLGIPTERIIPQNTRRLLISLETVNKGKSEQIIPIAVLAASMKS